jgi:hypothetical protein
MKDHPKYEEQWNRVLRWYERLKRISEGDETLRPSDSCEDDMYAFFLNCYHLKDWIMNDPSRLQMKDRVEPFIGQSEALSICADLCNGIKHLSLRKSRQGARFGPRTQRIFVKSNTVVVRPGYIVISKTGTYDASDLAWLCVSEWGKFFYLHRR